MSTCFPAVPGPVAMLENFYPFGSEAGDTTVPIQDDGSSPQILLSQAFTFYGRNEILFYVCLNQSGVHLHVFVVSLYCYSLHR